MIKWSLIILWYKRVERRIRKLVFIEKLLYGKNFISIKSFNSLSNPFILQTNSILERFTSWLRSHSQKLVEPEFKPKSYFVILRPKAISTCTCLPVIFIPRSADLGLLRVPVRNIVTSSVALGTKSTDSPPSFNQSCSHFLYFTYGVSWFHPNK